MAEQFLKAGDSFRDTLYTIDKRGKRKWVYPSLVRGRFFSARLAVAAVLIVFYLAMPWVTINGKQGILLDLAHRKFTFFGTTFWATDTMFLGLILGGLGISLFFFTALFGRVWCGWACPETIFLEFVFRPIERLIEGNSAQRLRLDTQPWTLQKVVKKLLKHGICAFLAWIIASTFLAYFIGAEPLVRMMAEGPQDHLLPFSLTIIFMALFGFQFGWFREQFCTILCPYARFQSVMMDPNSLVVGYDSGRGEPRGKLKKGVPAGTQGDCIDCKMCVRVCPTGIDIRNGLQLECVSCTQCIDACNSIMREIGKPTGLIRYDTENSLLGKKSSILRPRVVVYALILIGYFVGFSVMLGQRELGDFKMLRTKQPYSILANGTLSNHFEARVGNKSDERRNYSFTVIDSPQVQAVVPLSPFPLGAGKIGTTPIFLNFPQSLLINGKRKATVQISDGEGFVKLEEITLLGPEK